MSCQKPDKPVNPALQQENNKNLQALIAAREAQDAKWSFKPTQDQVQSAKRLVSSFTGDLTNQTQRK
jgi:hypothetical protein